MFIAALCAPAQQQGLIRVRRAAGSGLADHAVATTALHAPPPPPGLCFAATAPTARATRSLADVRSPALPRRVAAEAPAGLPRTSFVAATGPRENPQIVGQACDFIDPSTHLAETVFIVSPDWQRCGLGTALQVRMMKDAQQRSVRGFVAETMSTNDAMIRLAKGGWSSVSTESMGSTVRATTLF